MPIISDKPTGRSSRPRKTPPNSFNGKEDVIEAAPSPCRLPRKEKFTSEKDASSSGTQRTLCLRATPTAAKTKELVKGVCNLVKMKRTPWASVADAYLVFVDMLVPYILAKIEESAAEVQVQPVIKE